MHDGVDVEELVAGVFPFLGVVFCDAVGKLVPWMTDVGSLMLDVYPGCCSA